MSLLSVYGMSHNLKTNTAANVLVIVMLSVVALVMIANIVTWWQMIGALVHSQKHRVEKAAERVDSLKLEGLLQTLKVIQLVFYNYIANPSTNWRKMSRHAVAVPWGRIIAQGSNIFSLTSDCINFNR